MATTKKRKGARPTSKVLDAAHDLEAAHARYRALRQELRVTEGDIRRAIATMKRLTAPKVPARGMRSSDYFRRLENRQPAAVNE